VRVEVDLRAGGCEGGVEVREVEEVGEGDRDVGEEGCGGCATGEDFGDDEGGCWTQSC
jgi:hypothetical protein